MTSSREPAGAPSPTGTLPTPERLLQAPGYLARRLYQAYVAIWVREVDDLLTGPQFAVLVALRTYPEADQSSLAAAVALDNSTMTNIVRRLELRGLISRTPDTRDGRRRRLTLTKEGAAVLRRGDRMSKALDRRLLAGLDDAERDVAMEVLTRLSQQWAHLATEEP